MAKLRTVFNCTECGAPHYKWGGKCDSCGSWNSLVEDVEHPNSDTTLTAGMALIPPGEQIVFSREGWSVHQMDAALSAALADADTLREALRKQADVILWLAAIDRVPIEERIEWVATLKARYEEIAADRADAADETDKICGYTHTPTGAVCVLAPHSDGPHEDKNGGSWSALPQFNDPPADATDERDTAQAASAWNMDGSPERITWAGPKEEPAWSFRAASVLRAADATDERDTA